MLVYLLVDADSEDIAVPQRLPTEDQAVIEFLYRLIPLSGSVGVRQTDQFSAARMQLSRHLRTGGAVHDTKRRFATVERRLWAARARLWVYFGISVAVVLQCFTHRTRFLDGATKLIFFILECRKRVNADKNG